MAKHWIANAIGKPGALHRQLGVPQGQKIPAAKLAAAKNSDNPLERKRANLAATLGSFSHRAMGGPVSAGEDYMVGERGPEMLHMGAHGGGHVTPHHALRKMILAKLNGGAEEQPGNVTVAGVQK